MLQQLIVVLGGWEKAGKIRSCTSVQLAWAFMQHLHSALRISVSFYVYVKITRVGRDRDRTLLFRGWSRLCLNAASLSAAEGASAAAIAAARAARAETIKMDATAAAKKVKACHASADVAASREQAKREAVELEGREKAVDQVPQEQRERRAKMLVRG